MDLSTVLRTTTAAATLALGVAVLAPASAAPNSADQSGLVNLALQDTVVQVPIGIAANVCGVAVDLLAQSTAVAPVDCEATGVTEASRAGGGGGSSARQEGLVNVAVQGTTVQVPVAVAANICGLAVNALATTTIVGPTTCAALAEATADA